MAVYTNMSVTDTYDALLTTTLRNYRDKLEDNIFHSLPLWYWLYENGRKEYQDGGYQIMVPILYGENSTVMNYTKYDLLDTTPQEGITTARYDWKQLAVSISISRLEERQNSGSHKLIDLLKGKIQQAEESAKWYLNDMLHGIHGSTGTTYSESGNTVDHNGGASVTAGGTQFNSLDHLVRSRLGLVTSHQIGGLTVDVDAPSNAWWANYSIPGFGRIKRGGQPGTATTTTATTGTDAMAGCITYSGATTSGNQNLISVMRTLYNTISGADEHPDFGLTSQEVFEIYEGALMPLERFMDTKTGDAGFQNLRFKGMTLLFDQGITTALGSNTGASLAAQVLGVPLYMLTSKYISWTVDSQTDFVNTPFIRPENQDAKTAQILLMANLCCSNLSKQGVISCYNDTTPWTS